MYWASLVAQLGKESTCNAGDLVSTPWLGRSPGGGHGNPLQYSCLENPYGQRRLEGYSPWGHKELDRTERLSTAQCTTTLSVFSWNIEGRCQKQNDAHLSAGVRALLTVRSQRGPSPHLSSLPGSGQCCSPSPNHWLWLAGFERGTWGKEGQDRMACVIEAFEGRCGLPWWLSGKELTCQCKRYKRHGFDSWIRKIPWRRAWQPSLVFLPGQSHGQRSLAGCSSWGHNNSDTTAVT